MTCQWPVSCNARRLSVVHAGRAESEAASEAGLYMLRDPFLGSSIFDIDSINIDIDVTIDVDDKTGYVYNIKGLKLLATLTTLLSSLLLLLSLLITIH